MKTVNGSTTADYCYGRFNRLSGYYTTGSCSSPNVSYTYDANGNTATKTGGWTYSYDYENRLTKVTQSGATKQQDSYDGDGNRVKQVAGSTTNTYFYQGLNILYEKNVTGSTTTVTKRFYAGGLQVAKMVGSTTVYYLHQDALGNTRLETTSTVTIKFKSDYVPYGTAYQPTGSEVFRYTGKPYDAATGLYYMGARYYDPATGRFITQDSYPGSMSDPSSMNLYAYARDNPMRYTDPNGHSYIAENGWYFSPSTVAALFASGQAPPSLSAVVPPGMYVPTPSTTGTTTTRAQIDSQGVTTTRPPKPPPEDFDTWIVTSGFFQDPTHLQQLAAVVIDIGATSLQAFALELLRNPLLHSVAGLLFEGGHLTADAVNLVQDLYSQDYGRALSVGLKLASAAVKGLSFWDKFGASVAVGLNWGADILTEGDAAAVSDTLSVGALTYDAAPLVFEMGYAYGQYFGSFYS